MAKRILVIDDEARLLKSVAIILRAEGYDAMTAQDGAEALVKINQSVPDLIVSDIRMPGMDGHQLVRVLRQDRRTELIPIIFLTAKDERKDRLQSLRSGVDAFLTKPFDPEELVAVIANLLARVERMGMELARLVRSVSGDSAPDASEFADDDLTDAEHRIASLVARGLANKEIAAELGISVRTVEGHISSILNKKQLTNRVEIARLVLKSL